MTSEADSAAALTSTWTRDSAVSTRGASRPHSQLEEPRAVDGVAFSVLVMNMAVPAIDYFTKPRVFGHGLN